MKHIPLLMLGLGLQIASCQESNNSHSAATIYNEEHFGHQFSECASQVSSDLGGSALDLNGEDRCQLHKAVFDKCSGDLKHTDPMYYFVARLLKDEYCRVGHSGSAEVAVGGRVIDHIVRMLSKGTRRDLKVFFEATEVSSSARLTKRGNPFEFKISEDRKSTNNAEQKSSEDEAKTRALERYINRRVEKAKAENLKLPDGRVVDEARKVTSVSKPNMKTTQTDQKLRPTSPPKPKKQGKNSGKQAQPATPLTGRLPEPVKTAPAKAGNLGVSDHGIFDKIRDKIAKHTGHLDGDDCDDESPPPETVEVTTTQIKKKVRTETETETEYDTETATDTTTVYKITHLPTTMYQFLTKHKWDLLTKTEYEYVTDTEYDTVTKTCFDIETKTERELDIEHTTKTVAKKTITMYDTDTETTTETEIECKTTTKEKTKTVPTTQLSTTTQTATTTQTTTVTTSITGSGSVTLTSTVTLFNEFTSRFCSILGRLGVDCPSIPLPTLGAMQLQRRDFAEPTGIVSTDHFSVPALAATTAAEASRLYTTARVSAFTNTTLQTSTVAASSTARNATFHNAAGAAPDGSLSVVVSVVGFAYAVHCFMFA
ncbi:hypothetical protein KL947_000110 [Ogataea haglerorum]|nr:hypothetical protein KL947_000110 [Ogataea haglerorum]